VLTLSGASPTSEFSVIVEGTTPGGQDLTKTVACQVVSQLIFSTTPSNGVIIYEI
jgi:hypothetical protein